MYTLEAVLAPEALAALEKEYDRSLYGMCGCMITLDDYQIRTSRLFDKWRVAVARFTFAGGDGQTTIKADRLQDLNKMPIAQTLLERMQLTMTGDEWSNEFRVPSGGGAGTPQFGQQQLQPPLQQQQQQQQLIDLSPMSKLIEAGEAMLRESRRARGLATSIDSRLLDTRLARIPLAQLRQLELVPGFEPPLGNVVVNTQTQQQQFTQAMQASQYSQTPFVDEMMGSTQSFYQPPVVSQAIFSPLNSTTTAAATTLALPRKNVSRGIDDDDDDDDDNDFDNNNATPSTIP